MATPDIRVKLTADGVPQVISALEQVRAASVKAGKGAQAGFHDFGKSIDGLKTAIGALGVVLSVGGFVEFVKRSAAAAGDLEKMTQKIGGSIEGIAGLAAAARLADVDITKMGSSLGRFATQSVALTSETGKASDAFRRLGIAAADFRGKDLTEQLAVVGRRFQEIKAGPEKAALAIELFGKKGLELIPVLNALGKLAPETARRMGELFSSEAVRSAAQLNDTLAELGITLQGIGINVAAGIAGPVIKALRSVDAETGNSAASWQRFGFVVGNILAYLVNLLDNFRDLFNFERGPGCLYQFARQASPADSHGADRRSEAHPRRQRG